LKARDFNITFVCQYSIEHTLQIIAPTIPDYDFPNTIMALTQKTAFITGAGGGLGRAIAEHFISLGANIVAIDINDGLINEFQKTFEQAAPGRILAVQGDITNDETIRSLFEKAEITFGHVDIVINSAGIMDRFDPAGAISREEWDRVIAVNLTAPMMITQQAIAGFLKHDVKGIIVNITSIAGFRGFANG
jgi:NAD(P)-dependent dehydrogenase (short-subunit alcohol dehydrogenase family)